MAYAIGVVAGVFALAVISGVTYQRIGTCRDEENNPAPGRLIDVGTHRLHVQVMGESAPGMPTIVLESGLMGTVLSWRQIQGELAGSARVVSYDRAGLGWSERGPAPRTADRIADELHSLLQGARISPPYVLVGHSFGGLTMRQFAAKYPERVAGLVLIDPVAPGEWFPLSDQERRRLTIGAKICRRAAFLAHAGVLRFVYWLIRAGAKTAANRFIHLLTKGVPSGSGFTASPLFWNLAESERAMAPVFWVQPKFGNAIASQLENLSISSRQVNASSGSEDIPVTVISAGDTPPRRRDGHVAIARQSSRGKHLVADNSRHWVIVDDPKLVLESILEMVDFVCEFGPLEGGDPFDSRLSA